MHGPPLHRGDLVVLTAGGRSFDALVAVATENSQALIVSFDGMLGGCAGVATLLRDDEGEWTTVDGMPITLHKDGLPH